jgi:hypothetical protein
VILQRRFVDLTREQNLVGTVGLCRIQVIGAFIERGIVNILAGISGRIRPVPWLAIAGGKHKQQTA